MNKYFQLMNKIIKNPFYVFCSLGYHSSLNWIPDELYLKLVYRGYLGKKLNLKNPRTYNEKLQWLKLYDRNSIYTKMVDKYDVKQYVAEKMGEGGHIIPTLYIWNNFEEINFERLPKQFVLKCTHDSGGLVICRDKSLLDIKAIKKKIVKCLKRKFYYCGREWPYKYVQPRIIAEEYMCNEYENEEQTLTDYKFYCFNGQPQFLYVSKGLENHETACISFLTMDWKFEKFCRSDYRTFDELPKKPKNFINMVEIAKKLSKGIPFLRVDLYEINAKIYFSELTFYPCSGLMPFQPEEYDLIIGDMLSLPERRE